MGNGISNTQVYKTVLDLAKESSERDARVEEFCNSLQKEIKEIKEANKVQTVAYEKLRECFESLARNVQDLANSQKSHDEKFDRLFEKTDGLKHNQKTCSADFEHQKDICDDRFKDLEFKQKEMEKPVKTVSKILAKIGGVILTVVVTAVVTYFLTKLGIKG